MRTLLTFLLLSVLFNPPLFSQNKYLENTDSNIVFLSIEKNRHPAIWNNGLYEFNDEESYRIFIDTNKLIGFSDLENFKFNDRTLVLLNYSGVDCHSRFNITLNIIENEKIYDINVGIIYGGCRAGGRWYSNWISIPKVPLDYELLSSRVILENESELLK
jgi:hypothetical protein